MGITLRVHHCFFSDKGVGKSDKIKYSLVKWQEFHATAILLPTYKPQGQSEELRKKNFQIQSLLTRAYKQLIIYFQ